MLLRRLASAPSLIAVASIAVTALFAVDGQDTELFQAVSVLDEDYYAHVSEIMLGAAMKDTEPLSAAFFYEQAGDEAVAVVEASRAGVAAGDWGVFGVTPLVDSSCATLDAELILPWNRAKATDWCESDGTVIDSVTSGAWGLSSLTAQAIAPQCLHGVKVDEMVLGAIEDESTYSYIPAGEPREKFTDALATYHTAVIEAVETVGCDTIFDAAEKKQASAENRDA